jgi:tRNA dimethylallyltransferase
VFGYNDLVSILQEFAPHVFVLSGPTASGKTALGIELAERWNAEIVAMDSMTLYRGMDIGTAKPSPEERHGVPHHLLDVLDPWESASVAWWLDRAADCCRAIAARGRKTLFVGGTPLYLKALLHGLFDAPPADLPLRARLETEAETFGNEALHARLATVDPSAAARLHPNDRRRIVRALEVWQLTGRPMSDWQQQWSQAAAPLEDRCVWLDVPREELYSRIDARVCRMFEAGLIDEARWLRQLPHPLSREAAQAVGYREVFDFLDGKADLAATIARVQQRSRQLAKRQLTWFRHLPGCRPITPMEFAH